jgi:hypothetical protein
LTVNGQWNRLDKMETSLPGIQLRELEEQDRQGYLKYPDSEADALLWEKEAEWPEDQGTSVSFALGCPRPVL